MIGWVDGSYKDIFRRVHFVLTYKTDKKARNGKVNCIDDNDNTKKRSKIQVKDRRKTAQEVLLLLLESTWKSFMKLCPRQVR